MKDIRIKVKWKNLRWWSRYLEGHILQDSTDGGIAKVYLRPKDGQLRVHSKAKGWPYHGDNITVDDGNSERTTYMNAAGFYGKLHLGRF